MAVAGIHRFTVDDFARMGEAGIFTEDDRVELIDGEIRDLAPLSSPHAWIVSRLGELLILRLADRAHVRVQNPIRLGRHTEPQPDLAVARRARAYMNRHPDAGDLLLVVEVAGSSLQYDRGVKAPRYAKAGIPENWVVDIDARTVTAYTSPVRTDTPTSACCGAESALRRARSPSSTFRWTTFSGEPAVAFAGIVTKRCSHCRSSENGGSGWRKKRRLLARGSSLP